MGGILEDVNPMAAIYPRCWKSSMADTRSSCLLFNASCTSVESYTSMVSVLRTAGGLVRNDQFSYLVTGKYHLCLFLPFVWSLTEVYIVLAC